MRLFIQLCFVFALALVVYCTEEVCDANGVCTAQAVPSVKLPKGANAHGKPPDVSTQECRDRHPERCASYESYGECEKNPGWMIVNCPHSCKACHLLDPKVRCQREALNISLAPAFAPGEMDEMFSSIQQRFGDRYGVTIISTSPWVVTFDNFVSDEEAEAILSTVEGKFERSTDTGSANAYGETGRVLSQGRTSSNAW